MGTTGYVRRVARRLVVTGGAGFLGRRVCGLAAGEGWEVVAPSSAELDVRDLAGLTDLVRSVRPDALVHLAYRRAERDIIVDGSRNVASVAATTGVRLVHLSTDMVFGGQEVPYVEADPPGPVGAYGIAKTAAEAAVSAAAPDAVLVRTSQLLGEPDDLGQPQLDVVAAATGDQPFTFFTDEFRCPALAIDVARGVLALARDTAGRAGAAAAVSGPLHLAGPEALSRIELARRIARQLGLDPDRLVSASQADAGVAGTRPGRVVLDSSAAAALGLTCRPV